MGGLWVVYGWFMGGLWEPPGAGPMLFARVLWLGAKEPWPRQINISFPTKEPPCPWTLAQGNSPRRRRKRKPQRFT
eukprot:2780839-Pyramimonas_sp.AAC.1